jgi:hypothetical protein
MSNHNDIYSIVERLRILEEGLDADQKSVNQLSATFKPKTVAVLTAKTDPKNPLGGKLVGSEGVEDHEEVVEAVATEDILDKVKNSFHDYLKSIENEIKSDPDLKDKITADSDLKDKEKNNRDLVAKKSKKEIDEDPTEEEPVTAEPPVVTSQEPVKNPTYAESACVKSITMEDGRICEIHGNESTGFEIRHGNRIMPSRFKHIDDATMALEMFKNRRRTQDESQDYIDEA